MIELVLLLAFVGLVLCFFDLRIGVYGTVVAGFLQDPLRKMVPGEPVYLTALVAVVALVAFAGGRMQHAMLPFNSVPDWHAKLKNAAYGFVFLVIVQCMAAFTYTGSIILAGIGFMAYLAPFPALQMSYSFAFSAGRIRSFLWLYVAVNLVMASGVYLSSQGFDWTILHTVGEDLVVYTEEGGSQALPAGFYRVPEIAAWHASSGACIALALGLSSRRQPTVWLSAAVALVFFGAVLLTGRRKFLVEIAMFLPVLLFLLYRFKMGSGKFLGGVVAATVIGIALAATGIATDDTITPFRGANLRGQEGGESVGEEMFNRLSNLTVAALPLVLEQNGFFGSGAGIGSQGSQYFGGGDSRIGYSAEGGLGKILAELGVPGLLIILFLGYKLIDYVWQTLRIVSKGDPYLARLTMGLAAILAANGIVFLSAHQAYGDIFVLLIIGFILGFIIAVRRLSQLETPALSRGGRPLVPQEMYRSPERLMPRL